MDTSTRTGSSATTRSSSRRTATTSRSAARRASLSRGRAAAGAPSCSPSSSRSAASTPARAPCASSGRTTSPAGLPVGPRARGRRRAAASPAIAEAGDEESPRGRAAPDGHRAAHAGASTSSRRSASAARSTTSSPTRRRVRAFATEAGPQPVPLRGAARGLRAGRGADAAGAARRAPSSRRREARRSAASLVRHLWRIERAATGCAAQPIPLSARGSAASPRRGAGFSWRAPWNPLRAFGPRLQPIVHVADEEARARAQAIVEALLPKDGKGRARAGRAVQRARGGRGEDARRRLPRRAASGSSSPRATACPRSSTRWRRDDAGVTPVIGALALSGGVVGGAGARPAGDRAGARARGGRRRTSPSLPSP